LRIGEGRGRRDATLIDDSTGTMGEVSEGAVEAPPIEERTCPRTLTSPRA
jgi:hypothetical protein